ncbi:FAD-dependent oxidoreductase [Streptomyces sp. NPDC089424]|uniref:FAD-dependent oxidoreductase n=1 Tax=Streptomyces sp. NPDC089424 TaxID=3365917 RepID=UPI003829D22B
MVGGGSIAGLMAARVLADHAEQVVVIERDMAETGAGLRPGVPHGAQLHVLLPAARRQFDRWFPGFSEQALAAGMLMIPGGTRRYVNGERKVAVPDEIDQLTGSRPLIESLVRRRTLELPNVTTISGRVMGIGVDAGRVSGVRYAPVEAPLAGLDSVIRADFFVDAMGRSSRLGTWLGEDGWDRPAARRMTIDLNYATAFFRREDKEPDASPVVDVLTQDRSPDIAGAAFSAIEDARWIVTIGGYGDHRPGQNPEDFARRLRTKFPPEFGRVTRSEMLGRIQTYRHGYSLRRDYHRVRRFPAGVVAVGDAVATFNPIYGQGMSSAALHAACLSLYLRSDPDTSRPAAGFFDLQKVVVDAAWSVSTSADLALPHVHGPYPPGWRLSNWYNGQILAASVVDVSVARRFNEVTNMLRHPLSLCAPGIGLRALNVNHLNPGRGEGR